MTFGSFLSTLPCCCPKYTEPTKRNVSAADCQTASPLLMFLQRDIATKRLKYVSRAVVNLSQQAKKVMLLRRASRGLLLRRRLATKDDGVVPIQEEPKQWRVAASKNRLPEGSLRFVDYKRVRILAGHGGDGAIAFASGAGTPYDTMPRGSQVMRTHHKDTNRFGPPSGGSGGRGGDVYIVASKEVTSLGSLVNRCATLRLKCCMRQPSK